MDQLIRTTLEVTQSILTYFHQPHIWVQLSIIALLVIPALFIEKQIESYLVSRARRIRRMPGLLRIVIAFLRRIEWVFFILFLIGAYFVTDTLAWPESNTLIYASAALSGSWLVISVASHAIRNRKMRKVFAFLAWIYAAAAILGIIDDVALVLDSAGFSVG